jgi:hypothetical protein
VSQHSPIPSSPGACPWTRCGLRSASGGKRDELSCRGGWVSIRWVIYLSKEGDPTHRLLHEVVPSHVPSRCSFATNRLFPMGYAGHIAIFGFVPSWRNNLPSQCPVPSTRSTRVVPSHFEKGGESCHLIRWGCPTRPLGALRRRQIPVPVLPSFSEGTEDEPLLESRPAGDDSFFIHTIARLGGARPD